MSTAVAATETIASGTRMRLSGRAELVTTVLGAWLMIGLFVDGWAHNNLAELETFFTPWHALFYSGFAATAGWIAWLVMRNQEKGRRGLAAVPVGYGLGLVGVGLFAAGGAGDMAWHEVFGIEQGIEALFSPTHLLLFVGMMLILSSPLRAAWTGDAAAVAPTYRAFAPVLLSATLVTTLVAFMFMYFSAFISGNVGAEAVAWAESRGGADVPLGQLLMSDGIAAIMATNLILLAPLLLLTRRWEVPFGTATTLYTFVAVLLAAIIEFEEPQQIAVALLAGLAADALIRSLRPSPDNKRGYWLMGFTVPLVLWSFYFTSFALTGGIGWTLEMWTGAIMWAAVLGALLSVLVVPPDTPAAVRD